MEPLVQQNHSVSPTRHDTKSSQLPVHSTSINVKVGIRFRNYSLRFCFKYVIVLESSVISRCYDGHRT